MRAKKGTLTERQKRFADYYLECGNGRRAAERAGYSPRYATAVKHQPAVKEYLQKRLSQLDTERVAGMEEVLEYLTRVMRGKDEEDKPDDKAAAARMKAAELLGRRLEMSAGAQRAEPVRIVDDIAESAAKD